MPIVNFTVPDSSPWISYQPQGAWIDSDAATQEYTNGTFHFTSTKGAFARFSFNGSAVQLFGAFRSNHDLYTVSVDDSNSVGNGLGGDAPNDFNRTLFNSPPLSLGTHQVTLTNTPTNSGDVDLDWAVIQVGDGQTNTVSNDFWLDDTSGNFSYDKTWSSSISGGLITQYYNQSFHASNANGGEVTLTFFGNAIALYGATSTNHGGYSISLDGLPATNYNGSQIAFRAQQLLYYASSLATTQHTLVLTNTQSGTFTDVDFAIASRWDSDSALPGAMPAVLTPQPTIQPVSSAASSTTAASSISTLPIMGSPTSSGPSSASSRPAQGTSGALRTSSQSRLAILWATCLLAVYTC